MTCRALNHPYHLYKGRSRSSNRMVPFESQPKRNFSYRFGLIASFDRISNGIPSHLILFSMILDSPRVKYWFWGSILVIENNIRRIGIAFKIQPNFSI